MEGHTPCRKRLCRQSRLCLLFSIGCNLCFFRLLFFLRGLFSIADVLACTTGEYSSKEPENTGSNGAIAANANAASAGTCIRRKNQEYKRLQNASGNAKQTYKTKSILSKAAASCKDWIVLERVSFK